MGTGKLPKAMSCNTAKHHGQAFHPPGTPEGGWGGRARSFILKLTIGTNEVTSGGRDVDPLRDLCNDLQNNILVSNVLLSDFKF